MYINRQLQKANIGKSNVSYTSEAWGAEAGTDSMHTIPCGVWLKHTHTHTLYIQRKKLPNLEPGASIQIRIYVLRKPLKDPVSLRHFRSHQNY